jgi:hypothetical protein
LGSTTPTPSLDLTPTASILNPKPPEDDERRGKVGGKDLTKGDNLFENAISFGKGKADSWGRIDFGTVTANIERTAENINLLNQIAEALLKNPGSTIYLKLTIPKIRDKDSALEYNLRRFRSFARELNNRNVPFDRIIHINLPLGDKLHNDNIINLKIDK